MTKQLKVTYFKDRCVGTGACMAQDPKHFKVISGKANLAGGDPSHGNKFILDKEFSEDDAENLINAARACPVIAILISNRENEEIVTDKIAQAEEFKELFAEYDDSKEFVLDDVGYFLVRVNKEKKLIEVAFCSSKNKILFKVTGKKPLEIYQTILNKEKLMIRNDHAAYLGRELQKAYDSLLLGIDYVQDDDLKVDQLKK